MLDFQITQAPMRFGLAEGTDPHQVPFGTLVTAENCCWNKSGLLEKRAGIAPIGSSIGAVVRLFTRGTELCASDGSTLYSYVQGTWQSRGQHPELGLQWTTLQDSVVGARSSDIAYLSDGRVVQAWVSGDPTSASTTGDVYLQIVDLATGSVTLKPALLQSTVGYRVRVLASGTSYVVLFVSAAGILRCWDGTTTSDLKVDAASTNPNKLLRQSFDACVIGTEFVVAYALEAGGIRLVRYSFASTPVQQATATVTGEASVGISSISVAGAAGETLYIGYADFQGNLIRFAAANPSTLAQTVAPTTVEAHTNLQEPVVSICRRDASSCTFAFSFSDPTDKPDGFFRTDSITNAGAVTVGRSTAFLRLTSRPFMQGAGTYALVTTATRATAFQVIPGAILGSDSFVADATVIGGESGLPHRLVGKTDALIGGNWGSGYASTPTVVSSTRTLAASPFCTLPTPNLTAWRQGVHLIEARTGADVPGDLWRSISIGPETYIAGSVLAAYDGMQVFGYCWPHPAFIDPTTTATSGAGGSMATGSYIYNIVPERRSNVGILHRGPTATAYAKAVTGPTGKVTLAFASVSLGFSLWAPGIYAFYRSTVGGTIPQRLTIEPKFATVYELGAGAPLTLTDTSSDANIGDGIALATQPAIYTAGGELDDYQPTAAITLTFHQGRIWLVAGDGRTVWFSKDSAVNPGIAPGFHPTMILPFEKPLTALAPMDDKLIAFAADTFWYVVGVGPAPNGQNGDYQINRVQTDVGCTSGRSVVSTPDGIMFQSVRGLYLLTRSLELVWIGRPVKDQLAAFPNVTSAVLVASKNEVRFTCNNAGGTASMVLVWNYVEKQWTTARYTVGGVYGAPIADACMWNGLWTFATTGGVVVQESASTYLDGSTWVPMTIETARISAGGPLAFQAVRNFSLEGIARSNHDLTVSVGFDNETTYPQTTTFLAGSSVTTIGPLESCEISIGTRRKCQSIRFKIQDATPTNPGTYPVGTGQGLSLDMLGIEVGMKKGFAVRSASRMG